MGNALDLSEADDQQIIKALWQYDYSHAEEWRGKGAQENFMYENMIYFGKMETDSEKKEAVWEVSEQLQFLCVTQEFKQLVHAQWDQFKTAHKLSPQQVDKVRNKVKSSYETMFFHVDEEEHRNKFF